MILPRKILAALMGSKTIKALKQPQNEALVDVLVLAALADGQVVDAELDRLDELLGRLNWAGATSLEDYTREAFDRMAELSRDEIEAHVRAVGERLDEAWVRDEAYYVAALIAAADHELDDRERALLGLFIDVFDIEQSRLEQMLDKLRRDTDF